MPPPLEIDGVEIVHDHERDVDTEVGDLDDEVASLELDNGLENEHDAPETLETTVRCRCPRP